MSQRCFFRLVFMYSRDIRLETRRSLLRDDAPDELSLKKRQEEETMPAKIKKKKSSTRKPAPKKKKTALKAKGKSIKSKSASKKNKTSRSQKEKVIQGQTVGIAFISRLSDGIVVDSASEKDPLEFVAGSTNIIEGLSTAVIGMRVGERKTVQFGPEKGYGPYESGLLVEIERDRVPKDTEVGDLFSDSSDDERTWLVKELRDQVVILDGNHPLAGQDLEFDIKLLSVKD